MAEDKLYERFGHEYPAGHSLFKDGELGKEMFVVQSGKVKIHKTVRDVDKTLAVLGPGEFFGEMSILNNKPRSASATVEEPARLLVIDPKTFEPKVGVELDDSTHDSKKRMTRDDEVEKVFSSSGLPLVRIRWSASYDPKKLAALVLPAIATKA